MKNRKLHKNKKFNQYKILHDSESNRHYTVYLDDIGFLLCPSAIKQLSNSLAYRQDRQLSNRLIGNAIMMCTSIVSDHCGDYDDNDDDDDDGEDPSIDRGYALSRRKKLAPLHRFQIRRIPLRSIFQSMLWKKV